MLSEQHVKSDSLDEETKDDIAARDSLEEQKTNRKPGKMSRFIDWVCGRKSAQRRDSEEDIGSKQRVVSLPRNSSAQ